MWSCLVLQLHAAVLHPAPTDITILIVIEISYIQPALIAGVNSTRLRCKWFLHFHRFFLNIAPRLGGCAVVATIICRFLTYNADFAILRLWHSHRARLDTLVTDIPLWDFSANNFRTHTVRP
jgi:hypothetical protein